MSGRSVTRPELARAVYETIELSRIEPAELVDAVIDETVGALVCGEDAKISGFGSFVLRDKPDRQARNPRTDETATVPRTVRQTAEGHRSRLRNAHRKGPNRGLQGSSLLHSTQTRSGSDRTAQRPVDQQVVLQKSGVIDEGNR